MAWVKAKLIKAPIKVHTGCHLYTPHLQVEKFLYNEGGYRGCHLIKKEEKQEDAYTKTKTDPIPTFLFICVNILLVNENLWRTTAYLASSLVYYAYAHTRKLATPRVVAITRGAVCSHSNTG